MKPKLVKLYSNIMEDVAQMSKCSRKKVGALLVSEDGDNIIGYGWNGRPSGAKGDDCCEDEHNVTKPDVIHAELNTITKIARRGGCTNNSTLFVSLSPCNNCALLIVQSGIKRVFYKEEYRDTTGLDILRASGVECVQIEEA